jgi:trehalose 6-phosphate phosphatase
MARPTKLPPPPSVRELEASGRLALFLDFDGTLIDIAPEPGAIVVPPDLMQRLGRIARRLDGRLALVSGRSVENLIHHCGPLGVAVAGSHGAARFTAEGVALGAAPAPLEPALIHAGEEAASAHGLELERKTHGIAFHYRHAPQGGEEAERLAADLASRFGLTVKRGKFVAELTRQGDNKGGAVRAFMEQSVFAGASPIFVGDDVTDEDGFEAATKLGGFGVAVGERTSVNARYHLPDVRAVHGWLGIDG